MRKVKALPPQQWLSLADALARAKAVLGPSDDLAAHDLTQHLRAGRLTAGARHVLTSNKDRCFIFSRAFWQDAEVARPLPDAFWQASGQTPPAHRQPRVRATALGSGRWYVFIRRRQVDRVYPRADAADDGIPQLPRSKPGPDPTGDWPMLLGAWLIGVAVAEPARLHNIDVLVDDAKDFLQEKIGWAPQDTKDLRSKIRHFLQFVRS